VSDCIEFQGHIINSGYGQRTIEGKKVLAHRAAYEKHYGPIPQGLWVLHKCDNKKCVNPTHLKLGTIRDNTDDALARGQFYIAARTRAKLSEENVKEIRKSLWTQEDLAHKYGVTQGTISRIKSRVRQGAVQ
jgi:DNA-binding transcriptional regulator YiaG